jgi:hypothetical protein
MPPDPLVNLCQWCQAKFHYNCQYFLLTSDGSVVHVIIYRDVITITLYMPSSATQGQAIFLILM